MLTVSIIRHWKCYEITSTLIFNGKTTLLILRFADVLSLNERNTLMMMNSIFIEPHTQRYTHGSRLEVVVVNSPIFVTLANGEILLKGEYSVGLKIYI